VNVPSTPFHFKLRPYGDIHWGARACDKDKLHKFLSTDTPDSYYLSLGDDLNLIPHTDKRFRTTEVDQNFLGQIDKDGNPKTVFDAELDDYVKAWKSHKIPKERHLGVLEGNHCLVNTSSGMNPVQAFCMMTGYRFLGEYSAIVPISFHLKNTSKRADLIIIMHHGWGGSNSRQKGADVNKYIQHAKGFDNWDIALYGHTHNFFCISDIVLDCKSRKSWVEQKIVIVGATGTFLKTYEQGKSSTYSERGGMSPRVLSWLEIDLELYRTGNHQTGEDGLAFRYPHIVPSS